MGKVEKGLEIPCSYQGGKQRLAKQIADIILGESTKFNRVYDLCCGSGAVTLGLIDSGVSAEKITMVDIGCFGEFWKAIADTTFDLGVFRTEIENMPSIEGMQGYLKELSKRPVDKDRLVYQYLLMQSGSFGSKQIWEDKGVWKNCSFRSYWMPTETSNRRSPVTPLHPMPETIYERVERIIEELGGKVRAAHCDLFDMEFEKNSIIYIDPPYKNTTGYASSFDIDKAVKYLQSFGCTVYVSEGYEMPNCQKSWLLSEGRKKGNISGNVKKEPVREWLSRM